MNVLVACEESQRVCIAFRERGHNMFGHPYTKRTCLWLQGLPKLKPTNEVAPIATWCPSGSYSHKHREQHRGMFTTDRARNRAKTFEGIARAMAEQWG